MNNMEKLITEWRSNLKNPEFVKNKKYIERDVYNLNYLLDKLYEIKDAKIFEKAYEIILWPTDDGDEFAQRSEILLDKEFKYKKMFLNHLTHAGYDFYSYTDYYSNNTCGWIEKYWNEISNYIINLKLV
jgi:DNA primase